LAAAGVTGGRAALGRRHPNQGKRSVRSGGC